MNKKILFAGLVIIMITFMYSVSAESCSASISGKIDFGGENNSAAINATIQIVSSAGLLNSTKTDENGFYTLNISFTSPSKNIGVRMIKKGAYSSEGNNYTWIVDMNHMISINCGDNISINYSIEKCLAAIPYKGSIKTQSFADINETDEGKEVKIHLAVIPKDGKGVYKESTNFTKTDNNSCAYALSVDTYTFWPMNLYLWGEPTKNYYYRVYDEDKLSYISSPNFTTSAICSSSTEEITKIFIRLSRKNISESCSYNDECLSNRCYNATCRPSNFCINNSWCNATSFCNLTNNLCQQKKEVGENCSSDPECKTNVCNITCQGYVYYRDADNDGYGDENSYTIQQNDLGDITIINGTNYTKIGGDCNDSNPLIYPNATEIYNQLDDNCNSKIDECSPANSLVNDTIYCNEKEIMQLRKNINASCLADYECLSNNCNNYSHRCLPNITNFCYNNSDCCVSEFCNSSNLCQPKKEVGENCSYAYECKTNVCNITCQGYVYYRDADNDGYGDENSFTIHQDDLGNTTIINGTNYTKIGGDCNDSNSLINPNATEIYNQLDDNCNNEKDECSSANSSINGTIYCNENGTMQLKHEINASCSASYECSTSNCNNYSHRCLPNITNFCYNDNDCCNSFLFNNGLCDSIQFCNSTNLCQIFVFDSNVSNSNITTKGVTVRNSTINNSNLNNSTVDNSYINTSTINNSNLNNSYALGSSITSNSVLYNSTIYNSTISNSIINSSSLNNSTIADSNITNNSTLYNSTANNSKAFDSNITNNSTLYNSTANNSIISNSIINDSNLNNSTISSSNITNNSNLYNSTASNSIITNSIISGTNITNNSALYNSTASNSDINNSTISNSNIANNSVLYNSTISNSTISNSTISGSNIANNSILYNSTISNSIITNSTSNNSILNNSYISNSSITNNSILYNSTSDNSITSNSTINDSNLNNSTILSSNITNDSTLNNSITSSSTINNSNLSSSTITNSMITSSTISNSNITNNSVLYNSTSDSSIISNSRLSNSILNNSAITNLNISNSNITNSTIALNTSVNLQNASIVNNVMKKGILKIGNLTYKVNASGLYINNAYYSDEKLNLSKECNTDADCYEGFCDSLQRCRMLKILQIYPDNNKILNSTPTINVYYKGAVNSAILEFTFPNGTTQNLTANISKGIASFSLPSLQNGTYKFKAHIFDAFGNNISSELYSFTINTSAINIDYTNITLKQNAIISKNFTIGLQSGASIDQIWALIKNEATNETITKSLNYTAQNGIYSAVISTENLPDGNYAITVYANDTNGNIGCAGERAITIDNTKPYALITISVSEYSANLALNFSEKSNLTFCYWNSTSTNCISYPYALFHALNLSNLQQNKIYYFNATFCDLAGNCNFTTGNFTTKPADTIPPLAIISIPSANITNTSVVININFSEKANLTLRYGTDSSNLNTTILYSTFNTAYSLNIQNLASNRLYFLNLTYCDEKGNCNSTSSSFSTLKSIGDICSNSNECYNSKCLHSDANTKRCSPLEWECRSNYDCGSGKICDNHKCSDSTSSDSGSNYRSSGSSSSGSSSRIITTFYNTYCGDKSCDLDENCSTCPEDCGICIVCGDKICEGNETYLNCPADCKKPVICGDKICEGNETYLNCPADCKKPVICGDKICEGGENYSNCPADCKKPVICGDKICEGNETCETCSNDCGKCMLILIVPSKLKEGEKFVAKVTTKDGKPVENAKVSYGNLTLYTNASGEVMLTASGNVNKIEVEKENYVPVSKNLSIEKTEPTGILALIIVVLLIVFLIVFLLLLLALLRKRKKKDEKVGEKAVEIEEEEKQRFTGEGGLAGLSNVGDVKDKEKQGYEKEGLGEGGLGGLNF